MEQILIHWLQNHIPFVATWVIGLPAVVLLIKKYGPVIRRWVKIIREGMDMIDTLLDALQDNKITDDEVKAIVAEVQAFKEACK